MLLQPRRPWSLFLVLLLDGMVKMLPDAPLLKVALGAAMLGTEKQQYIEPAVKELQSAVEQEHDNAFAWYELAQAYARMGQTGRAELATRARPWVPGPAVGQRPPQRLVDRLGHRIVHLGDPGRQDVGLDIPLLRQRAPGLGLGEVPDLTRMDVLRWRNGELRLGLAG